MTQQNRSTVGRRLSHPIQRSLPRHRPGDGRSPAECALAARMLLKLKNSADIRWDQVQAAQARLAEDRIDTREKLDVALDRMIDELESEQAA